LVLCAEGRGSSRRRGGVAGTEQAPKPGATIGRLMLLGGCRSCLLLLLSLQCCSRSRLLFRCRRLFSRCRCHCCTGCCPRLCLRLRLAVARRYKEAQQVAS
jgi:hypothetical protein